MQIKYIIASPGRSGSIFVANTISRSLGYTVIYASHTTVLENNMPPIYHTHDATFQIPDNNLIVVQPYRKDIFKEIISAVIAEKYNEWFVYSNKQEPFVVDLETFKNKYQWHKNWHRAFEHYTRYKYRKYLCFEDFIGNSIKICNYLGIPEVKYHSEKSPYTTQQILNFDELQEEFIKLELNPYLQNEPIETQNWTDQRAAQ
jgi:hypothetical protein